MPTVEIDGRRIAVEDGTTVIQAAERLGIEVPHYCWHPGLPIAGNCRMCLVEIEKMPKLQIACNTRVTDGMAVHTTSEKTKTAQKAVLEFLLINHPIDCPVCDQAGECKLQEYYMDYDRQQSRITLPEKVHKKKAKAIGPLVILDQERCVLCSRCVRFVDGVTKTSELAFFERGNHVELDLAAGKWLDNKYSGNVVDICPVGALTSRDFRFRARVWYLERTESICGGCANGCNIEIYHREGRIFRFQPRENQAVNQYWMCDEGRMSYRGLQGEGRLTVPLLRGATEMTPATWAEATAEVKRALEAAGGAVGIVVSAQASNEEIFLLRKLGDHLEARVVGVSWSPPDASHDDFLIKADKNPNTQGLVLQGLTPDAGSLDALLADATAGKVQALVLFRTDLTKWVDGDVARKALEAVPFVVVMDTDHREAVEYASVVLPIGTYAESDGTFVNFTGRVQRFRKAVPAPGEALPGWEAVASLSGNPVAGPDEVFGALAGSCVALRNLGYDALGGTGAMVTGSA